MGESTYPVHPLSDSLYIARLPKVAIWIHFRIKKPASPSKLIWLKYSVRAKSAIRYHLATSQCFNLHYEGGKRSCRACLSLWILSILKESVGTALSSEPIYKQAYALQSHALLCYCTNRFRKSSGSVDQPEATRQSSVPLDTPNKARFKGKTRSGIENTGKDFSFE